MRILIITCFYFILFGCGNVNREQKQLKETQPMVESSAEQSEMVRTESTIEVKKKGRCDVSVVLETEENLESLSDDLIYLFLYTFGEECKDNAEYSEFSNEVLFQLLYKYPKRTAINLLKEDINKDIILNELKSPINDIIDVNTLYELVTRTEIGGDLKSEILSALKVALSKLQTG